MCYVLFAFYHVHDFYLSCNLQRKSDLCHNPSSSPGIYSDAVFHCSIACLDLVVLEFLFFLYSSFFYSSFLASFIILCNANHSAHVGHFSHSHSCTSAMMWQFWHCGVTHAHEHYFVRPFRFLSSNDFDSDDPGFKAKKSYPSRATMVMNRLRGEAVSRGVQWVFS